MFLSQTKEFLHVFSKQAKNKSEFQSESEPHGLLSADSLDFAA